MPLKKLFFAIWDVCLDICAAIEWSGLKYFLTGKGHNLTLEDWFDIRDQLNNGYYIILTRRNTHLTTYGISLAHFALTGKFGHYSHALCNVEPLKKAIGPLEFFTDFRFMEAIKKGVIYSNWFKVFDCDSICILKPKYYTQEEFDSCVSSIYDDLGKQYDKRLNVHDMSQMSCVELARERMLHLPDYHEKMRVFEYMIKNEKNLTPQMFRDCPDFEVVLEIKR